MNTQRRRFDFHAVSSPVLLGDGQTWQLPVPLIFTRPGKPSETHLGVKFDELTNTALESETRIDHVRAVLDIGAFLIRQNYYVSNDDLQTLLTFDLESREKRLAFIKADEEYIYDDRFHGSDCLIEEIERVAFGIDEPKTFKRWVRLSVMAGGQIPEVVPICDWHDLAEMLEQNGRAVSRMWCPDIKRSVVRMQSEKQLDDIV